MNNSKYYPKVLIINKIPFNIGNPSGETLRSLFKGWPRENIACIYKYDLKPDMSICNKYWKLESNKLFWKSYFDKYFKKREMQTARAKTQNAKSIENGALKSWIINEYHNLIGYLWQMNDLFPRHLSKQLFDWIDDFKPSIIYTCLGDFRMMDIVLKISDRFSLPIVPHLMDDWLSIPSSLFKYSSTYKLFLVRKAIKIFKKTQKGLAIGKDMAEEYMKKFGKPFEVFMNTADVPQTFPDFNTGKNIISPLRFAYYGAVHLLRAEQLFEICRVILEEKRTNNVEIFLYVPETGILKCKEMFRFPNINIRNIETENAISELAMSDILIFVESFNSEARKYTRLSVSTKIPMYMAAGRPIFAYGPGEVSSIRYIKESGCGIVVENENKNELANAIKTLMDDSGLRERLGRKGWETARANHDAEKERELFRQVLCEAQGYNV